MRCPASLGLGSGMGKGSSPSSWFGKLIEGEIWERKSQVAMFEFYLSFRILTCENEHGMHSTETGTFIT